KLLSGSGARAGGGGGGVWDCAAQTGQGSSPLSPASSDSHSCPCEQVKRLVMGASRMGRAPHHPTPSPECNGLLVFRNPPHWRASALAVLRLSPWPLLANGVS